MIRFTLSHDQNMQIPGAGMRVVPRTADVFLLRLHLMVKGSLPAFIRIYAVSYEVSD